MLTKVTEFQTRYVTKTSSFTPRRQSVETAIGLYSVSVNFLSFFFLETNFLRVLDQSLPNF